MKRASDLDLQKPPLQSIRPAKPAKPAKPSPDGYAGRDDEGPTVLHHIFNKFRGSSPGSQKYRDFFKERGIDVDQYAVPVSENFHQEVLHGAGNNWTTRWKTCIDENPTATSEQVFEHAAKMMDE